jgi:predicted Zn-dependent protease with MMP-like domain
MTIRIHPDEFAELVDQALASLPESFRPYVENLVVEIQPRASRALLEEMEVPPGEDLLGLYRGVPVTEKSVSAPVDWPERIIIFQRPIEAICDSREELIEEVQRTVLHELGHHFGFDEEGLGELGYD